MPSADSPVTKPPPVIVYLGLGSNTGDRWQNLRLAMYNLSQKIHLLKVSPVYDTTPVGNTDQPRFLNLVCEANSLLTPAELLVLAKEIETKLGREPGPPNSPRPIDIDILFYGDLVVNSPNMVIPHPRLHERAFVLVPLSEIAPNLKHPVSKKTVKQLLTELNPDSNEVIKWEGY